MMEGTKAIKGICKKTGKRFGIEIAKNGGVWQAVNLVELDDWEAEHFTPEVRVTSLATAETLIPCRTCGGRTVFGCACAPRGKTCQKNGKYDFQCMYCREAVFDYPATPELWFVMDVSASMRGEAIEEAKRAAYGMLDDLDMDKLHVGVMTFEDNIVLRCEPTGNRAKVYAVIRGLRAEGGTNEPLTRLYKRIHGTEGQKFIVLLTDGEWRGRDRAIAVAQRLKEEQAEIVAIGFGDVEQRFLKKIATSDELAIKTTQEQLVDAFQGVGRRISNIVLK